ncbi:MAG: putative signal transducing protein [Anaerolineae bacterium]
MDEERTLVVVYRSAGQLGAEVVRAKLEAAGIPAMLAYDSGSTVFALTVDGLGEVHVLVPAHLAEEARALLRELPPEDLAPEEDEETP